MNLPISFSELLGGEECHQKICVRNNVLKLLATYAQVQPRDRTTAKTTRSLGHLPRPILGGRRPLHLSRVGYGWRYGWRYGWLWVGRRIRVRFSNGTSALPRCYTVRWHWYSVSVGRFTHERVKYLRFLGRDRSSGLETEDYQLHQRGNACKR